MFVGSGGGDVGVGNAILPSEVIFVPERPKEAEEQRCTGKEISETAPSQLARFRKAAVHSNHRKAIELHPKGCAGEEREQAKVEEINQEKNGTIDCEIDFKEFELSPQGTEHQEKAAQYARKHDRIDQAGDAAGLRLRQRTRSCGGMDAVSLDHGKIKLRLRNVNFNVLNRSKTSNGARSNSGGDDRWSMFTGKRQQRLGRSRGVFMAARAVNFQAASNLAAPFRLFGSVCLARRRSLGERNLTKWTDFQVAIANSTTLRADLNHRFVLRCGP